jgi:hypothetical protein
LWARQNSLLLSGAAESCFTKVGSVVTIKN